MSELESPAENPHLISVSLQQTRQHLTETTQIQPPGLSLHLQSPVENSPFEGYTESSIKVVPQAVAKVNPVTTYRPDLITEIAVSSTDSPLLIHTTETNFIENSNNTLLTELLQKLQGTTQPQSQLSSNRDHVDVDYSIVSLFKILNDFKRAKEIVGSPPDHQYYVQSDSELAVDYSHEKPLNGSINMKYTIR